MADIYRVTCPWTGFAGAPASTVLYFKSAPTAGTLDNCRNLFNGIATMLPSGVNINVLGTGYKLDETTGIVNGSWVATAPATINGIGTPPYSLSSGACITWHSGTPNSRGHLVKGRSFMVPLVTSCFGNDGTLDDTKLATLRTNATGFITTAAGSFVVWARPYLGRPAIPPDGSKPGKPAIPPAPGFGAVVLSAQVTDMVAVLRSRR